MEFPFFCFLILINAVNAFTLQCVNASRRNPQPSTTKSQTTKTNTANNICDNVKVLHTHKILYGNDCWPAECRMYHSSISNVIMMAATVRTASKIVCKSNELWRITHNVRRVLCVLSHFGPLIGILVFWCVLHALLMNTRAHYGHTWLSSHSHGHSQYVLFRFVHLTFDDMRDVLILLLFFSSFLFRCSAACIWRDGNRIYPYQATSNQVSTMDCSTLSSFEYTPHHSFAIHLPFDYERWANLFLSFNIFIFMFSFGVVVIINDAVIYIMLDWMRGVPAERMWMC